MSSHFEIEINLIVNLVSFLFSNSTYVSKFEAHNNKFQYIQLRRHNVDENKDKFTFI